MSSVTVNDHCHPDFLLKFPRRAFDSLSIVLAAEKGKSSCDWKIHRVRRIISAGSAWRVTLIGTRGIPRANSLKTEPNFFLSLRNPINPTGVFPRISIRYKIANLGRKNGTPLLYRSVKPRVLRDLVSVFTSLGFCRRDSLGSTFAGERS